MLFANGPCRSTAFVTATQKQRAWPGNRRANITTGSGGASSSVGAEGSLPRAPTGTQAGLCLSLKGRGATGAVPERLQSGYRGRESGWGAVTGGWKCGRGWCWGMGMPLE